MTKAIDIDKQKLTISFTGWKNSMLSMAIDVSALADTIDFAELHVSSSDAMISCQKCIVIPEKGTDKSFCYVTIFVGKCISSRKLGRIEKCSFTLKIVSSGGLVSERALVFGCPQVAGDFCKGVVAIGASYALADAHDGVPTLYLINQSIEDVSIFQKLGASKEAFSHLVLSAAAKQGAECFFDCLDEFSNGSLNTEISIDDDRVLCSCSAKNHSLEVDITSLPLSKEITLLDEGKKVEELSKDLVHEEHFDLLLDMLSEFDDLCAQNNIEYFLAYGTLLGAIRHDDFIPWDNDIDLFMTFGNYQKLRNVFELGLAPEGRELEDMWSTKNYSEVYARYRNTNTTRFTKEQLTRVEGYVGPRGIFLDIFLLLPASGDMQSINKHIASFLAFTELKCKFKRKFLVRNELFVSEYNRIASRISNEGHEEVIADLEKTFYVENESADFYFPTTAGVAYGELYENSWLYPRRMRKLRGRAYPIPNNSAKVLRTTYGPGFRYYPKNHALPDEKWLYTSTRTPERFIVDEYSKDADISEAESIRKRYKKLQMEEVFAQHNIDSCCTKFTTAQQALRIEAMLDSRNTSISTLVSDQRWDEIDDLFASLYLLQKNLSVRHVYIPLAPDFFKAAVMNLLCNKDNLPLALRLVQLRKEQGDELSTVERETVDLVEQIISLRDIMEDGDFELANQVLTNLSDIPLKMKCIDQAGLYLELVSKPGYERTLEIMNASLRRYNSSGEVEYLLIAAEGYMRIGEPETCVSLLHAIKNKTLDGMILLHLERMMETVSHE